MFNVVNESQEIKTGYIEPPLGKGNMQSVALKFTTDKLLQSQKAFSPMIATDSGMVTVVNLLQDAKAVFPIARTELGMSSEVAFIKSLNELRPIAVIPSLIRIPVMEFRELCQGLFAVFA